MPNLQSSDISDPRIGTWENAVAGPGGGTAAQMNVNSGIGGGGPSALSTINPHAGAPQISGGANAQSPVIFGPGGQPMMNPLFLSSLQQGGAQGQSGQPGPAPGMPGYTPTYRQDLPGGYNSAQYADLNTTNDLARYLGAQTVQTQNAPGSPIGPPSQYALNMSSGDPFNAGLVADIYAKYPRAVADQIMGAQMASAGVGNGYSMVGGNPNAPGGGRSAQEAQFNSNVQGGANFIGQGQFRGAPTSNSIGQGGASAPWQQPQQQAQQQGGGAGMGGPGPQTGGGEPIPPQFQMGANGGYSMNRQPQFQMGRYGSPAGLRQNSFGMFSGMGNYSPYNMGGFNRGYSSFGPGAFGFSGGGMGGWGQQFMPSFQRPQLPQQNFYNSNLYPRFV